MTHVVRYVHSEDVITVNLGVELAGFVVETGETLRAVEGYIFMINRIRSSDRLMRGVQIDPVNLPVRDEKATVDGSLQNSENLRASRGTRKSGIQMATERLRRSRRFLDVVLITVDFGLTGVDPVHSKLLQQLDERTRRVLETWCITQNEWPKNG